MLQATSCAPRSRRTRALLPLTLLALALALVRPGAVRAQDPLAAFEQGVFEVSAERLPPLTLLALVDSAGSILLPVRVIAEYLGFELQRDTGVWRLPRLTGTGSLLLDTRTLIAGADTLRLAPAELVRTADDVYLRSDRLARLLEGEAAVDFGRLVVVFARNPPFPAQQRLELEQRRAVLRGAANERERPERLGTTLHTGGGILDWDISTNGLDPGRLTLARAQIGAALLGGGLTAGATLELGRAARETVHDRKLRYHRVFAQPWLQQAEAGDIMTHGLYARFITGAELTNAPYLHDYDLGEVQLRPDLPPGWQYEVLQGRQLLGYSEPGASAPVSVPLRTGATPIEVRMYGPAGEEVVERLVYQTPVGLLPRGRLQYVLGGGRCQDTSCDEYAHADLRWGGWSRVTLGAGAELLRDSTGSVTRPYLLTSFTTGTALTAELHAMPDAAYRGSLSTFVAAGTSARLSAGLARPGYRRVEALGAAGHRWDLDLNVDRQLERQLLGARALRFTLGGIGQRGERPQRWRFGIAAAQHAGFTELRLDHANTAPDLLTLAAARTIPFRNGPRSYHPAFTGRVALGSIGVHVFELGTLVQPIPFAAVSAALQWSRTGGTGFTFAWNSRIGPAQATFRTSAAGAVERTSSLGLSGSVALVPPRHLFAEPISRTGYGGVHGTVFLDQDGDGQPDPGEPVLPGLPLQIGSQLATTDSAGRFVAWGLLPYVRTAVAVDSLRISDPSWTLARARLDVIPAPNSATRVDVPLVQTRELAGAITADPPIPTTGGLTLIITSSETGTTSTTVTFSDGTFYVSRLRPGDYTLAVSPAALDAIGAAPPPPLPFTIPATGDEPLVELPPLRLHPRR